MPPTNPHRRLRPVWGSPNFHRATFLEVVKQCDSILRREILEEHVIDLNHWSVHTRTEAFDLCQSEIAILGCLSCLDSEMRLDGVPDEVCSMSQDVGNDRRTSKVKEHSVNASF